MNRPFIPTFLKKFDRKLLIHKPDTWSTRIHLLVYYSVLFCLAVGLFAFATFNDPRQGTQSEIPIIFTSLISVIGFIVWLIFLLRFNVFKRFGEYHFGNGIKTFILFFTVIFFIVLPNYIPLLVESWKANAKYSSNELVKDANRINELIVMKHKNMIPTVWNVDSFKVLPAKDLRLLDPYSISTVPADTATDYVSRTEKYDFIDREDMNNRLWTADSSIKITDSTYAIYTCPELQFVSAYDATEHSEEKYFSSQQLYDSLALPAINYVTRDINVELNKLLIKYNDGISTPSYYNSGNNNYDDILERDYELYKTNSSIRNISDKKYLWDVENFPVYFRLIFYISFCLGLLLFIFRHTTIKTFFLSILTVVLLMIFNGLLLAAADSDLVGVLGMMLVNYFIIVILMIASIKAKSRTILAGVTLNIVCAITAFIPMLCVLYYYEMLQSANRNGYVTYENQRENLFIAEVVGLLLLLLLLEPVFKKLYRKWYALPEN